MDDIGRTAGKASRLQESQAAEPCNSAVHGFTTDQHPGLLENRCLSCPIRRCAWSPRWQSQHWMPTQCPVPVEKRCCSIVREFRLLSVSRPCNLPASARIGNCSLTHPIERHRSTLEFVQVFQQQYHIVTSLPTQPNAINPIRSCRLWFHILTCVWRGIETEHPKLSLRVRVGCGRTPFAIDNHPCPVCLPALEKTSKFCCLDLGDVPIQQVNYCTIQYLC